MSSAVCYNFKCFKKNVLPSILILLAFAVAINETVKELEAFFCNYCQL